MPVAPMPHVGVVSRRPAPRTEPTTRLASCPACSPRVLASLLQAVTAVTAATARRSRRPHRWYRAAAGLMLARRFRWCSRARRQALIATTLITRTSSWRLWLRMTTYGAAVSRRASCGCGLCRRHCCCWDPCPPLCTSVMPWRAQGRTSCWWGPRRCWLGVRWTRA